MTKLIIFDLDGTLLDTREDLANACNYALRECGCPERRLEEYNMLVGRGIYNLFRGALPPGEASEEMVAKMRDIFVPYYNRHLDDFTKPYPGVLDMLDRLAAAGISFAVASNKYQEGTESLVKKYFGKHKFAAILGQREGKPIKPDPEIVYEAMRTVPGVSLEEVIYCGDSDVDMQTGINAGVRTIGVTWGFRTREELSAYSPWLLAEDTEEIISSSIGSSE